VINLKFNKLIPELTVFNIEQTRDFYLNILGFKLEYERIEDSFIFISFENSQFMFER
jgi:catechol 2,3-dioxygenase-like lactoylglutathione lyase family enzyme